MMRVLFCHLFSVLHILHIWQLQKSLSLVLLYIKSCDLQFAVSFVKVLDRSMQCS